MLCLDEVSAKCSKDIKDLTVKWVIIWTLLTELPIEKLS